VRGPTPSPLTRLPPAAGAVASQATLALGSFLLQLLAARALGADGLGVFAMLLGSVVIATSVSSGLVGDSLTVLDRHDPAIRAALARLALAVVAGACGAAFALSWTLGSLSPQSAVLFAAATGAFMIADLLRRTIMACQRFWRLVVVDVSALVAALVLLVLLGRGRLTVDSFLSALLVGQVVACIAGVQSLPRAERQLPTRRRGGLGAVLAFGSWRAVQQFVRPTTLNLMRWLVLITTGQVAVGELEAARLFAAPAMLLVQGVGAYLFSSYAAGRDEPMSELLRRADRGAAALLGVCGLVAAAATVGAPALGPVLTGNRFELATLAVLGWAVYAASCAVVLPYGSLAAVRGDQAKVLGLRVLDSLVGLGATGVALLWLGLPVWVAPWLLATGSVAAGVVCRQRLLVPRCDEATARPPERTAIS
jgi:O-antigen/teichoic acid export membrane protein